MGGQGVQRQNFWQKVFSFFVSFYRDDRGQATSEYLLILSVTITGTIALARIILSTLDKGVFRLGAQLERDLKTGRAQLGTWQN